jgi:hypothetical protein
MVVLGADAHKRSHTVVAVDDAGRTLGARRPPPAAVMVTLLITWAH